MNHSDFDHDSLLRDLFESPRAEVIVQAVRREKLARRRRRQALAVAIPIILLAVAAVSLAPRATNEPSRTLADAAETASSAQSPATVQEPSKFQVEHIDDRELVALLEGHPVALVRLPSGERKLLMVVHTQTNGPGHTRRN